MNLFALSDFFPATDIEWKPGSVTKDKKKGLAMGYITNRAIQDRLDAVVGPARWRNEFRPGPDGGVLCGISIRVTHEDGANEWVTKWDGAENSDFEAVKGGLSNSMKRAAVQWGIGRYLYDMPSMWVPLNDRGRFERPPAVPAAFLPAAARASAPAPAMAGRAERAASKAAPRPAPRPEASPEPAVNPAVAAHTLDKYLEEVPAATRERVMEMYQESAWWPENLRAPLITAINKRRVVFRAEAAAK